MTKILSRTACLLILLGAFSACEKNVATSKDYTSTLEASIDATEVTLTGTIISPLTPEDVTDQYFLLSEDKSVPEAGAVKVAGVKAGSGKTQFTGKVTDFKFGSTYYYKSVVVSGGKTHAGNVRSFRFEVIPITSLKFEQDLFYSLAAKKMTIFPKVSPENATYRKQLSITTSVSSVAVVVDHTGDVTTKEWGTTVITATDPHSGIKATCKLKVMYTCPNGATDLGLSVYWGDRNMGADFSYQPGYYYRFGETTPRTSDWDAPYTEPTYENGVLAKANDPAQAKGTHWRMPTEAECRELMNNCTFTLGLQSGRYYVKAKSKINGKEICLPLGGNYSALYGLEDDNRYFSIFTADANHLYSRRTTEDSKTGDEVKVFCNGLGSAKYGRNVRPVTD